MPYLYQVGLEAHRRGIPFMRPMQLEFGDDPATDYLDRQYLLGAELLVAPVFSAAGDVQYYLPAGTWTSYLTGERATGPTWRRETHAFDSIPLWVREGAVLVTGARHDRPDYDYTDGSLLTVYPGFNGTRTVEVANPLDGTAALFTVSGGDDGITITSEAAHAFGARRAGGTIITSTDGKVTL
jgi:alpha-D-xyloside xylohydrolase